MVGVVEQQLREARLRAGMTQAELGEATFTGREAISEMERGMRPVPDDVRRRAARVLNAPELILDDLQVVFADDLLGAVGWCREEMAEALDALEEMDARVRRGQSIDGLDKQVVWDVRTALATVMVALSREGVDVFESYGHHVEHLRQSGYIDEERECDAA